MDLDKTIDAIVNLIKKYQIGNKSIFALVKETGYFEIHDQVNEKNLMETLGKHPDCILEWISYPEDKRTSSGWYIRNDNGKNIVGYFTTKEGYQETTTEYPDIKAACAVYIKNEIEFIRSIQ